jgi:hypothetical protein
MNGSWAGPEIDTCISNQVDRDDTMICYTSCCGEDNAGGSNNKESSKISARKCKCRFFALDAREDEEVLAVKMNRSSRMKRSYLCDLIRISY